MPALRVFTLCCAALFFLTACHTLPETEERVSWVIENRYNETVLVAFYSQDRVAAWPDFPLAYVLEPGEERKFNLVCRSTEKICFGAGPERDPWGSGWGVGYDNVQGCSTCCMICREGAYRGDSLDP